MCPAWTLLPVHPTVEPVVIAARLGLAHFLWRMAKPRDEYRRAKEWLFRQKLIAWVAIGVVVLGAVVGLVEGFAKVSAWIAPGGLKLVSLSVIDEPQAILSFRREWLGDTSPASTTPVPENRVPILPRAVLDSLPFDSFGYRVLSSASSGTSLLFDSSGIPAGAVLELRDTTLRVMLSGPTYRAPPRGTGRFPILDLKFRNTGETAAFLTHLDLRVTRVSGPEGWNIGCFSSPTFMSPSWEYNILLNNRKATDVVTLQLSQVVPARGIDRFVVVVGQDGYNEPTVFDLQISVRYNEGRRMKLGDYRVRVEGPDCGFAHALDDVHKVTPTER